MQRLAQLLSVENRAAAAATLANVRVLTENLRKELVGIDKAIAEVGGAAREFRRAAGSVAAATDRVGHQAAATLDDTRALIADLRSATTEAQRSVAQVGSAVAALQADANRVVVRLDAGVAHFDEQLLVAISDLRTSLETMQRSLDRLGDPRAALLGPDPSRLGPGERLQ